DSAAYLIQLLSRMGSPAARQSLSRLAQGEDVNVGVEARVHLSGSPDAAQKELNAMLDSTSVFVRIAALRAASRYGMRNVWPTIARIIGAKNFNELGSDERRELLRACMILSAERGEPILLDIVKKSGGVVLRSGEG